MNYVKHSVAAHERLRARPDARPHHVSLYWALFFAWNAARFPDELPLHHEAAMQAARIGSKHTYRAALYDLDAWGLLAYRPSQSRYDTSRCRLTDLSGPQVAPMPAGTEATSGLHETAASGPEVTQALGPEVALMNGSCGPEVAQDTLLNKTEDVNSGGLNGRAAGPKKKAGQVFAGEGQSEAQIFDDNDLTAPGAAPKKKVAPKKKGVGERPEPRPRRPASLPELPFRQLPLYDLTAFTAAFAGTDYALADLPHYHQLIDNWRDKKTGLPPTRRDWAATARRFMLNDAHDNRLKPAPGHQTYQPGAASPAAPDPGARPAGSGYRSKYDA